MEETKQNISAKQIFAGEAGSQSTSSLGSNMLPSQDQVTELFEKVSLKKTNPSSTYKIDQKVGNQLYRARRKSDNMLFVIKSVKRSYLEEEGAQTETNCKNRQQVFNNELVALKKVTSPHIIGFCEVFEYKSTFIMVLEYISGGPLTKLIKTFHEYFSIEFCQYTLYCVALGIRDMHRRHLVHR